MNGFGLRAVSTLSASGGVATATTAIAHGYEVDAVIRISGASPAGFNGDFRITAVTDTSFTFATAQPNGSASGTIEARIAPLGWERPFSGTNIAVYRSADPESTRMFLRVEDTGVGGSARVRGFEDMTGPSTGVNGFPLDAQVSGGGFWGKANTTAPTLARRWMIIGDGKTFYYWYSAITATSSNAASLGVISGFGDFASVSTTDVFNCFIAAERSDSPSATHSDRPLTSGGSNFAPRSHTGFAGSHVLTTRGFSPFATGQAGSQQSSAFPNPADNGLILVPTCFISDSNTVLRGAAVRGLLWSAQNLDSLTSIFFAQNKITGLGPLAGKKYVVARDGSAGGGGTSSSAFFDLLGPWV